MIEGKGKTEANYRAIYLDSSSSLKEFSLDRKKYYKKYILNETVEEKDNLAANMGMLVETLLMEPELFDEKFYMSSCVNAPTGLMLEFVTALYTHTASATDEFGNVSRTFEEISKDAYVDSGFKIKYEAVLTKFIGSDAEIYYREIREVKSKGLTVVTSENVTHAQKIVEELKTNFVTAGVINLISDKHYTIHNQFQIEGYSVDGHLFKSMLDKLVIDHKERTIQVYDLKCTWSVENFYEEYYLYRRSYIQALLYYKAAISLTITGELQGYRVKQPKFIVCDSINYMNPLIYTLDDRDLEAAYNGFEHKGRKYPGVREIIENLIWAQTNNIWNISKQNYINNGEVNIKL